MFFNFLKKKRGRYKSGYVIVIYKFNDFVVVESFELVGLFERLLSLNDKIVVFGVLILLESELFKDIKFILGD